ncbi:MAG: PilZ domain-containing protein [Planctomycetes bacterium]|nr:PilZ domain-containing protein [Planctomycetota bacterium]
MSRGWVKRTDALMDIARNVRSDESHEHPGSNHRRFGRIRPGGVKCNLGKILDLSASGVRLKCKRPITGDQVVEIRGVDQSIRVLGRVVWGKKVGFRAYEIGLHFLDIPDEAAALIRRIAGL